MTINDLTTQLRTTPEYVAKVPVIEVVEREGQLFTLDHRRLVAFQAAGLKQIPDKACVTERPGCCEGLLEKVQSD